MKTAEAARGRWYGILQHFGVSDNFLENRHGPCPMCQGRDRYRFDDKDGNGTYFCSGCGPGDGFKLLSGITGKDFKDLAREIDGVIGNIEKHEQPKKTDPAIRINRVVADLLPVSSINPVRKYLQGRGLKQIPAAKLRLHPGLRYYEQGEHLGTYPAMVASLRHADGSLATLHITHLTEAGDKAPVPAVKKMLPPIKPLAGASIQLTDVYPEMAVAEGIETAIAVMNKYKIPCWAAANAGLMSQVVLPGTVKRLTIYGDNDNNFAGHKAAYTLANRMALSGVEVQVVFPEQAGSDFADKGETA